MTERKPRKQYGRLETSSRRDEIAFAVFRFVFHSNQIQNIYAKDAYKAIEELARESYDLADSLMTRLENDAREAGKNA